MNKYFIIVRTGGGRQYAKRVRSSIRWLNRHIHKKHNFTVDIRSVNDLAGIENQYNPEHTVIYSRAAYPDENGWMRNLINLERRGFRVINKTSTLLLTSNKLECALGLQDNFPHPRTWQINKGNDNYTDVFLNDNIPQEMIIKPETSISQGAHVIKFNWNELDSRGDFDNLVSRIPGNVAVLQEYVPYTAIYRVIVIGGKALPYSFVDRPEWHDAGDWKVSVCLNRTTMQFLDYIPPRLQDLAERVQKDVGGEINFIDFFETDWGNADSVPRDGFGKFVISEINTACNLTIHERLARGAGRSDWNIHYRIAKYLVTEALNE